MRLQLRERNESPFLAMAYVPAVIAFRAERRLRVKTGKAQCEQMFSTLPLRADIAEQSRHVRFVPLSDMARLLPL